MYRLENKIALVTGADKGIGRAIAELFVKEQATVILTDIHPEIEPCEGAEYLPLNVSQESDWRDVTQHIQEKYGRLDILVNNAGITDLPFCKGKFQDPEAFDMECWDEVHNINLKGVALGCKYAIGLMKASPAASIINISSVAGMVGLPGTVAYSSSKAAVRNHTKSVAVHCAEKGYNIRCNSLHPGAIITDIWKPLMAGGPEQQKNTVGKLLRGIPMNRLGTADEVAKAALFLASDDASYITGSELNIDGGMLASSPTGSLTDA